MHPSLALCMIVRNEEACLARCLESVAGAVDEIYVTDTGSTDGTVEIARRFGAAIRHFHWGDDFAAARNFSIAGVPEDWILFLDADDWFPPGEAAKIRMTLALEVPPSRSPGPAKAGTTNREKSPDAYEFSYELMAGHTPARACRMFRNGLGLRFEGIIHENLRNSLARIGATTGQAEVTLKHTGYTAESLPGKLRRNLPLLQREWQRCSSAVSVPPTSCRQNIPQPKRPAFSAPPDRAQRLYVGKELALAYLLLGREPEGEKLLQTLLDELMMSAPDPMGARCAAPSAPGSEWEITIPATLFWHYHEKSRWDEALELGRRLEPLFGRHPVFRLYRGIARFGARDFAGARADLATFENYYGANELTVSVPDIYTSTALWDLLGQCHLQSGDAEQAASYFVRCQEIHPGRRDYEIKLRLAMSLQRSQSASQPRACQQAATRLNSQLTQPSTHPNSEPRA
jgi:tetratricopeptide (TPR) repeat protein